MGVCEELSLKKKKKKKPQVSTQRNNPLRTRVIGNRFKVC